jgi:hypothetical protein
MERFPLSRVALDAYRDNAATLLRRMIALYSIRLALLHFVWHRS